LSHRITDERISYLKQLLEKAKNWRFLIISIIDSHTTIAKASNNRILAEFIEENADTLEQCSSRSIPILEDPPKSVEPEVKILEALETP